MNIPEIQKRLREFAAERDWEQFHTPKNLVMALTGEVGELAELFQWLPGENCYELDIAKAREELADILIYVFMIADKLGINLDAAVTLKIFDNSQKYPVSKSKGNATKYNQK
jgi:NTP pyrophosphatase (non-canonical NTP hydrolase)